MKPDLEIVKKVIWTLQRNPFAFGIRDEPVGVEVEGIKVDLGKGFTGIIAMSPSGRTVVAEFTSGAIVGHTVEEVRNDILIGVTRIMEQQVAQAMLTARSVKTLPANKFWTRYERS